MEFKDNKELEEFIQVATMIKYFQSKKVPIPDEVLDELEANKDSSEVFNVLYEMAIS